MNVAKYFAILKMRDFEIENILDKGENANKLNYYRNIAIDYQFGKDIRLYNLGNFIIYKYGRVVKNIRTLISTQIKIQNKWGNISALSTLLSDIGFYTITFFLVINNHLEFASLFLLIGLYEVFSHNYRELIEIVANIKKDGELYNIYAEFMNISGITIGTPKSNGDAQHQSVEKCTIEFCNVSFMYPNSDNYILRNINLSVSSDEKIGLIGENGAGKSTIVKLLIGLYTPTSGEILINGIKAEAEELRCLASAVFQESDIFAMTLFENIFPHNSFDEPALGSLLKTFDLEKDFLKNDVITNPMMLKILDEKGFVPSGGVKQKLLFMRALLRLNIKFLVLDEPTSSLDSHSELALYSILGNMPSERGAVIISHRLAITNMVDRVIVLSKGMIVADGTHEKLLRKNEEYRLLYEAGRAMYGSDAGGMPEWN
ncbi:MAG: ATP-binding cassette domain-containing protein [Defluviitaleaceae bacterium]|nr:ATP-binding cassette domain-containing protein [Defluviitaleaceae bacterium]